MTDRMTKEQRSYIMSRIGGKWTLPERELHNHLKGNNIKHMMHPKIDGNPDAVLKEKNVTIFVDGCFWHGCPKCYSEPTSNVDFWRDKVRKNRERDKRHTAELKRRGWKVIRFWEHEMDDIQNVIRCIKTL